MDNPREVRYEQLDARDQRGQPCLTRLSFTLWNGVGFACIILLAAVGGVKFQTMQKQIDRIDTQGTIYGVGEIHALKKQDEDHDKALNELATDFLNWLGADSGKERKKK